MQKTPRQHTPQHPLQAQLLKKSECKRNFKHVSSRSFKKRSNLCREVSPKGRTTKEQMQKKLRRCIQKHSKKHPNTCTKKKKSPNKNVAKSTPWRPPETLWAADDAKNTYVANATETHGVALLCIAVHCLALVLTSSQGLTVTHDPFRVM